jgi:hypothetical protein
MSNLKNRQWILRRRPEGNERALEGLGDLFTAANLGMQFVSISPGPVL